MWPRPPVRAAQPSPEPAPCWQESVPSQWPRWSDTPAAASPCQTPLSSEGRSTVCRGGQQNTNIRRCWNEEQKNTTTESTDDFPGNLDGLRRGRKSLLLSNLFLSVSIWWNPWQEGNDGFDSLIPAGRPSLGILSLLSKLQRRHHLRGGMGALNNKHLQQHLKKSRHVASVWSNKEILRNWMNCCSKSNFEKKRVKAKTGAKFSVPTCFSSS